MSRGALFPVRPTEVEIRAELASVLRPGDTITVADYGDGLGHISVLVADWMSPAATWFRERQGWTYEGPAMKGVSDGESVSITNWVRYGRLIRFDN